MALQKCHSDIPREAENSGKGGCVLCLCLSLPFSLPPPQMATYCELHCAPHQHPSLDSYAQLFLFRMSLRQCMQVDSNPE